MPHAAAMAAGASRLAALVALVACTAGPCAPAAAQQLSLETYRRGDAVAVYAEVEMDVDPAVAWAVLTDYDHLAQFIPDMSVSRVLSRTGNTVLVEQKGEFGILFFRQSVELRLEIVETPKSTVAAHAVGGSFREMSGRYDLAAADGRVRLTYAGRFVPSFSLPPFLGIVGVRHTVATQLEALVDEIVRRDAKAKQSARR
jgi:carbon monoxide dehydrogenase subunit G